MVLQGASWGKRTGEETRLYASLLSSLLALLFCLVGSTAALGADSKALPSKSGLPFAIADFDGDGIPNLAIVQPVSNSSSLTRYRIQVQLGDGGLLSTDVVAPVGGLRIVPYDVNNDGFPDLIVSPAWSDEPLAVLVNDGHAVFSRIDPASLPHEAETSEQAVTWLPPPEMDSVATPVGSQVREFSEKESFWHSHPATGFVSRPNVTSALVSFLLVSLPSHAPPRPQA